MAKLGGRYADWLAVRRIDSYVDLSTAKRQELKPRVHDHIVWIKKEISPLMIRDIDELTSRVEKGLAEEDLAWLDQRFDVLKDKLQERLMSDSVWLLTQLSSKQVEHLEKELAAKTNDIRKKTEGVTPERYQVKKLNQYEETFEEWLGPISSVQKELLRELYKEMATVEYSLTYVLGREQVEASLVKLLRTSAKPQEVQAFLETWWRDPAQLRSSPAREQLGKGRNTFRASVLPFEKTLSTTQRKFLVDKLRRQHLYLEDFSRS
jgi:cell division protein FtsI/penicillin-binding protein 2